VALFWLKYRHREGRFAGAVVIEATALIIAQMQAAVFGLDEGLDFVSGHELDRESVSQIPQSMIGPLLDDRDLLRLQRLLLSKQPPAPSLKERPSRQPGRRHSRRLAPFGRRPMTTRKESK
jgi:hypothetical protein